MIEEMIAIRDIIMAEKYYNEEVKLEQMIKDQHINIERLQEELTMYFDQSIEQDLIDHKVLTTECQSLLMKYNWIKSHLNHGPYLILLTKDKYTSIIQEILDHLNTHYDLKNQKDHLISSIDSIRYKYSILSQQLSDLCLQNEQLLVRLELAEHMQSYKRKRQSHDDIPLEQPHKKKKIIEDQYTRQQLDIPTNEYYDLSNLEFYLQETLWQQSGIRDDIGEMESQKEYLQDIIRQILRESLHNNKELKPDGIYVSEKKYMGLMDDIHFSVDENNQLQNQINSLQSELDELKKKESLFSTAREIILSEKEVIVTELYNYGWMDIIDSYLENGK